MPGGRGSEVIPGSLVVPGSILEPAMLAWLGSDVMGQVQLTCPLTHSLVIRGAILAPVVFLDTRLPTSVSACYFQWKVPMDGVKEKSCGCPGTRVVCSMWCCGGGVQLDGRRWDLQGAVAGGAAAELEIWSLLPAVCSTWWKLLSVLGHCRSET